MAAELFKTKWRIAAAVCFALPFVVALPLGYWFFYVGDTHWIVATRIDPEMRLWKLQWMYVLDLIAFTAICWFVGLLLYYVDGYNRRETGCLLIPVAILALLASIWFGIHVVCYFEFG